MLLFSTRCLCKTGYKQHRTNHQKCVDFDECTEMTAHCPPNSSCRNRNGSYECKCDPGFIIQSSDKESIDNPETIQCFPDDTSINAEENGNRTNKGKRNKKRKKKVKIKCLTYNDFLHKNFKHYIY